MTTASPPRELAYLALEDIPRAERNAKEHDLPAIKAALKEFGCTLAGILDGRTGRLVAGHGRLQALEDLKDEGAKPPEGVLVDDDGRWLAPIVRGWASRSDTAADAYGIADNRINQRGGWNERALAELLDEIADYSPDLIGVTGYTADELDDLISQFGEVPEMEPGPTAARYAETDEERAERAESITSYADRKVGGAMTEMILVFPLEDHAEAVACIRRIRARDGDSPVSEVVLAALRAHAGPEAEAEADVDAGSD